MKKYFNLTCSVFDEKKNQTLCRVNANTNNVELFILCLTQAIEDLQKVLCIERKGNK